MIIKWKINIWNNEIKRVERERETDKSVWVREKAFMGDGYKTRRRARGSEYYDTWEEAHAYLADRAGGRLVSAHRALKAAKDDLEEVATMSAPED